MNTVQPPTRVLLLDLDNCPNQIQQLPETLATFTRAIACYGGAEPKVPIHLVQLLGKAISEGKLEIIGMEKRGKNAADFGLTFWAGKLATELPPGSEFLILSQDTDLDHVVNLLRREGRKAARLDGKTAQANAAAVNKELGVEELIEVYFNKVLQNGNARPGKKVSLLKSIKSHLKKYKGFNSEEILRGLERRGLLRIDGEGRVIYAKPALEQSSSSFNNGEADFPF